jgi:hypothetical protein
VPYGGGAILNELDGNLTLKNDGKLVSLHWQAKLRGLDFTPKTFRFEIANSPDLIDAKGRSVQLPILRPMTNADAEAARKEDVDLHKALLRVMLDNPSGTQRAWADTLGKGPGTINKVLQRLKAENLVDTTLGQWNLTPKGEKKAKVVSAPDGNTEGNKAA